MLVSELSLSIARRRKWSKTGAGVELESS